MEPPNLREILGVTPFFHLVPKQDLAPLVSFARVHPKPLEPRDFLPSQAGELVDIVEKDDGTNAESVGGLLRRLSAKFRGFDCPELDSLTFKRPVIAGESDKIPEMPETLKIFNGLVSPADCVPESGLVEFGDDLDLCDFAQDRLDLLNGTESQDQILQHMNLYKQKFDSELARSTRKRTHRANTGFSRIARRRITLDRSKLKNSRLIALYGLVDEITDDISAEVSAEKRLVITTETHGLVLTALGLREIGKHLSDLVESSSIADCDAEYLKEIQGLCLNTIRYGNIPENDRNSRLYRSLGASSLLLVVLNTNLQNRELYLQSYTDTVVEFLVDTVPLITEKDTLVGDVVECLEKLSIQLTLSSADDHTLTQIEYMCINAIFRSPNSDDSSQLRDSLVSILTGIFKTYPGQRRFIVNEMLSNITKLAHHKGLPRQVQISHGVSVSFFTVFLVDLIQSFDATELRKDVASFLALPQSDNPHSASNVKRGLVLGQISSVMEETSNTAEQVAEYFLGRITPADSVHKAVFTGLVEELCAMMSNPEYPGAETVVSTIIQKAISAMEAQKIPAPEEPFALGLIGKFGQQCLELKMRNREVLKMGEKFGDLARVSECHQGILYHLKEHSPKSISGNPSFQFQLLKTLVFYKNLLDDSVVDKNQGFTVISKEVSRLSHDSINLTHVLDKYLAVLTNDVFPSPKNPDANPNSMYRSLILATTLDKLYADFLAALTVCLESSKVKLAAKAIRVLSPLVTQDPKILLHSRINASITKVLSAGSSLSKDAVIELLGQYMFSSKDHLAKYYVSIGNRAGEDGIMVRKRVMKIMREVFSHAEEVDIMVFAASKILRRLEDEETSIVDASRVALRAVFFDPENTKQIAEVMVELINSGRDVKLFMGFVHHELRSPSRKERFECLKKLFDEVFNRAVDTADSSEIEKAEKAFALIAALAECDPSLVAQDQLVALRPFLVEEMFDRELMCLSALRILKLALPGMKALRPEYVSKTNSILLKRLTKFQIHELHEAVQIIEAFSQLSGNSPLIKAAISSMRILWPSVLSGDKIPQADASKVRKVIHLLGCFGSYCNFEHSRELFLRSHVGLRVNESVVSLVSRYLLYFCQPEIELSTRVAALKNLLCVAASHPRLFLSEPILGVLDRELRSSSQKSKLEIVKGLAAFLQKEDENLAKKNEDLVKSSKDINVARSDFFADGASVVDGVCSSVIQRYIDVILGLCVQDASEVGEHSVYFLRVVTKLGFANPKLCISTVIALEASPKKTIKRIATELHAEIFEKHESLADRNYVEAFRMACRYLQHIENDAHLRNHSFLRAVYRVINTTYSAKKKFINSTVRLFRVNMATEDLTGAIAERDTAVFLALNLSVLNFTTMEEVCLVLFHLNRFITGEGIDLAERVSMTIGSVDGKGMSVANLQLLFVFSQTVLAFILLKQTLVASYCVRPVMMDGYRPSKPDMELRQPPKIVAFVDYPLGELNLEMKLSSPGSFGAMFTRLVQATKTFTM